MARARGIAVIAVVRFVSETWGVAAHQKVLAALPVDNCGTFIGPLTESSWRPLGDLGAYAEIARQLLAPDDPGYYRKLGRFVGNHEREHGGFKPMVADPHTTMRLAAKLWRALYEPGRCEVEALGPHQGIIRISEFPASRGLCQSNCGAIEGLASNENVAAKVEEVACVLDGSPYCEFKVHWD